MKLFFGENGILQRKEGIGRNTSIIHGIMLDVLRFNYRKLVKYILNISETQGKNV